MENKLLDQTSLKILALLREDGRAPYSHIAQAVGLSAPAVKERILKLEDAGIITGYTVQIDPKALGQAISAFMLVEVPPERDRLFAKFAHAHPHISECFHVLGDAAFILRVQLAEMGELEQLINECLKYGSPKTYMVFSQAKP